MVRSVVDDVRVIGAYEILKLVMTMDITPSGQLTDSSDRHILLLGNLEREKEMPMGQQRIRITRSMACS